MPDRLIATLDRHGSTIAILVSLRFWASMAVIYARVVALPDIPQPIKDGFFPLQMRAGGASSPPRIEARRKANAPRATTKG